MSTGSMATQPEQHSQQVQKDEQWQQVLAKDARAAFLYAVTTTGVFCRPDCPSRRPARAHVRFFADAGQARAAGFRACLRCTPESPHAGAQLGEQVAKYVAQRLDRQVSLAELARLTGLSPFTVQRVFSRVMGLSPRAYANALRAERYRAALLAGGKETARITDAVYAAGFSGPGRAQHAAPLGMAAKRYQARGRGEQIGYISGTSGSMGQVLVAATERGICAVLMGRDAATLVDDLRLRFPHAKLNEDKLLQPKLAAVLQTLIEPAAAQELPLDLRATAFQARVWAALAAIPRGETRSYAQVAADLGNGKAVRAVARACAQNPVALLVPCHRVVGSDGKLTGYRWGLERKQALLAIERE